MGFLLPLHRMAVVVSNKRITSQTIPFQLRNKKNNIYE